MSALIIGLSIAGAFAGAATGIGLKSLNFAGRLALTIGTRSNVDKIAPECPSLPVMVAGGAIIGSLLSVGTGLAYEALQGEPATEKTPEAVTTQCEHLVERGFNVTLETGDNGKPVCRILGNTRLVP